MAIGFVLKSHAMSPIRPQIRALDLSGITKVTMLGLGDPDILPLWFGETDLVTPKFIRDAATAALEDGKTFYTFARGIPPVARSDAALSQAHRRAPISKLERITIPGAAMLAVVTRPAKRGRDRRQYRGGVADLAQHFPGRQDRRRRRRGWCGWTRIGAAGRWHLDLQKLFDACDARTKAMFICSPGNPTGWMATAEEQKEILDFARATRHRHHQRRSLWHADL